MSEKITEFSDFFYECVGLRPYKYQVDLAGKPVESRAIHVPTGAGKTAAVVLAWLWNLSTRPDETSRRLAYCLPMRTLVRQTGTNVRKWVERFALLTGIKVSVHILMGGEVNQDWAIQPEHPAILIGTQEMLLSRGLNRGYGMSRYQWPAHFGMLSNDCAWIMDEVQLMGDGLATSCQLAAFRERFGVFGSCPTIWMSATMDAAMLKSVDQIHAPEMFRLTAEDSSREDLRRRLNAPKKVAKAPEECCRPAGLAEFLAAHHRSGTQTIAVVNRVGRARETFDELRRIAPDQPCELLHSRFRPAEKERWRGLLDGPVPLEGRILISTQVIEAGVDISSALLVTDLAPWSSLVQRFGRCNRAGELDDAEIYWVDRPLFGKLKLAATGEITEEIALPYAVEELQEAESRVSQMASATIADLPNHQTEFSPKHVLRRRDLLDLFDTTQDLSGYDLDVSRFIRSEQDRDVLIAWREAYPPVTKKDAPGRDELCPAPIHEVEALLKGVKKGRNRFEICSWNALESKWRAVDADALRPGMMLVANAKSGGYSISRGWDTDSTKPVPEALVTHGKEEGAGDEPRTFQKYAQTLEAHTREVHEKMREIINALPNLRIGQYREELLIAALHHDWGKAHEVFQKTVNPSGAGELMAKATGNGKHGRPYFRHELASALALLQNGASDLTVYLAAAHHGKVRLSIRAWPGEMQPKPGSIKFARGIYDGDLLPAAKLGSISTTAMTLDLAPMLFGMAENDVESWTDRMLELQDRLGVFRLAYLEALIVAADWRASNAPKEVLA